MHRAERETLLGYAAGCPNANLAFERAGRYAPLGRKRRHPYLGTLPGPHFSVRS